MKYSKDFAFEPDQVNPLQEVVGRCGGGRKTRTRHDAPKFIQFDEFSWEKFFRAYKLSEKSNAKSWTERIQSYSGNLECCWALRFLSLIHFFEARNDESNGAAANRIVKRLLGIDYAKFYGNDKLKSGLAGLGIQLRVDKNKHNQYLRTVLFYSGWMYVRFARRIAKAIRKSSWNKITEHDFLCELLKVDLAKFRAVQTNDELTEEELTLEDVVTFFQSLARLYLRYNAPFSVEDIKELAPLKTSVATHIIEEMCSSDDEEVASLKDLETLPQIDLDSRGRVIFGLPRKGHFAEDAGTIVFLFRDKLGADVPPFDYAAYNLNSDGEYVLTWKYPGTSGVPFNGPHKVRSIARVEPGTNKPQIEVIPQVCLDTERSHLLLRLRDSKTTECGYELDSSETDTGIVTTHQKLSGGIRYKVVPLNGSTLESYILCGNEKIPLDAKQGSSDGCFCIPGNADTVVIGTDIYDVKTAADTYLNMDERVRNFDNPGRLFFERSCNPFTDACLQNADITAVYAFKKDGRDKNVVIPFEGDGDWELPESVLWQPGTLVLTQGDDLLFKRAVTFVDDLTLNAFDKALDIEEAKKLKIRIGDEDVLVDVPKRVRRLEIPYRGFKFFIPVRRTGVYFEFAKQVIPIPLERAGVGRVRDLARKDFENLKCRISTSSEFDIVQVARGNTNIVRLDERSFVGNKLLMNEALQGTDSDYFALCVTHDEYMGRTNSFYKFHLYDPQCKNVAAEGEHPHSVIWKRDPKSDDLVVTYWIPFCDQNRQKHIAFFPAHRQDQPPMAFIAETSDKYIHEVDEETGRCKETIRIPHFFKEEIDWGRGLICFIAHKQIFFGEHRGYEVLSSGFFMKAPDDKVTEITDDPFGLRVAFVGGENGNEDGEALLKIMSSDDPATQEYVAGFLDRMKDAVAELKAYPYLNAYWNKITRENGESHPSGYAFMAGSYFSKVFADKVASEPYVGLWCRRLIGYKYLPLMHAYPMAMFTGASYSVALDQIPQLMKLPFWKMVKSVIKHVDPTGSFLFKQAWSYSYAQLSEAVRLAHIKGVSLNDLVAKISFKAQGDPRGVVTELYSAWEQVETGTLSVREITSKNGKVRLAVRSKMPDHGNLAMYNHSVFRPLFGKYRETPYLFYGDYDNDFTETIGTAWEDQRGLSEQNIYSFVKEMGLRLHKWRKNPSLKDAQELRQIFVFVDKVDALVATLPNRPNCGLMDFIENVAWALNDAESKS